LQDNLKRLIQLEDQYSYIDFGEEKQYFSATK